MLILGNDRLSRFLNAAKSKPWCWGEWDCGQWLGAWIFETRGVNPAEEWFRQYHNAFGAARLVQTRGGMIEHIGGAVEAYGLSRVLTPKRGDIAVVEAAEGQTGAIVMDGSVVRLMEPQGLVFAVNLPVAAAWSV